LSRSELNSSFAQAHAAGVENCARFIYEGLTYRPLSDSKRFKFEAVQSSMLKAQDSM
jgi:hypothetical protein